jgi:hypothetical protein
MRYIIVLLAALSLLQGCGSDSDSNVSNDEPSRDVFTVSGTVEEISHAIQSGSLSGANIDATIILPEGDKTLVINDTTGDLVVAGLVTIK